VVSEVTSSLTLPGLANLASLAALWEGVEGVGLALGVVGVGGALVTFTGRGVGGPSKKTVFLASVFGFFLGGGESSSTSSFPSSTS